MSWFFPRAGRSLRSVMTRQSPALALSTSGTRCAPRAGAAGAGRHRGRLTREAEEGEARAGARTRPPGQDLQVLLLAAEDPEYAPGAGGELLADRAVVEVVAGQVLRAARTSGEHVVEALRDSGRAGVLQLRVGVEALDAEAVAGEPEGPDSFHQADGADDHRVARVGSQHRGVRVTVRDRGERVGVLRQPVRGAAYVHLGAAAEGDGRPLGEVHRVVGPLDERLCPQVDAAEVALRRVGGVALAGDVAAQVVVEPDHELAEAA